MKKLIRVILFLIMTACFSCEEQGWFVKCSECLSTEPETVNIELRLKDTGSSVLINIYEGEVEDSVLLHSALTTLTEYSVPVGLNRIYTATATYHIDGNTYTAVDSAIPRVKYTEDQCEDPCYYIYDSILDLRLKYLAAGD
jgi:hypothetical protein